MSRGIKKFGLIIALMIILFGVGYLITQNLALAVLIAILGTVILK